jgi:predicted acetyltransferase
VVTAPTARLIQDDELADWLTVPRTAMLGSPITAEGVETIRGLIAVDRCIGAYDGSLGGRPVGSAGSFGTDMAVPGGRLPVGAVTAVGVLPTHRRRGHLTRLMQTQLADIVERDEPAAVLVAAEYPIYGRFGYGPGIDACGYRVDTSGAGIWVDPPSGSVELVDNDTFTKELVDLYDRVWPGVPGHLEYDENRWPVQTGKIEWPGLTEGDELRKASRVLWRDAEGDLGGVALYTVKSRWDDNRPQGAVHVNILVTATAEAERELVRYLSEVDWTTTVHLQARPVDDPVALWLHDGRRAAQKDRSDHVWVRVLDVPRTLSERRYAADGRVVLEVHDDLEYAAGRFALDGGPEGALCSVTDDAPDLVLDVKALGAAYLGGVTWSRLADAGWVQEARSGALERATTMFAAARAPWCALTF